jgi:hypothetical protein
LATGGRDPTNSDGTTTDTLSFKNYAAKTNGTFSAVSETGNGGDLATAYQSLLSAMQANGETDDATISQLKDTFSQHKTNPRTAARMPPSPAGKCWCRLTARSNSPASPPIRTALLTLLSAT